MKPDLKMPLMKQGMETCHGSYEPHETISGQGESMMMRISSTQFEEGNPMSSNVYKHSDKLGAGAKKRSHLRGQNKVHAVMGEYKRGTLHSGSGAKVHNRKQAIAIAMSEAGKSRKGKR